MSVDELISEFFRQLSKKRLKLEMNSTKPSPKNNKLRTQQ